MAQTVNGIIARENYEEDFLSEACWTTFVKLANKIGCLVIGKNTYEFYQIVKRSKKYNFDNLHATKFVLSSHKLKLNKGYVLANSPKEVLSKASKLGFNTILLSGGGVVNTSFMKLGLIDEMILNVEPYILAKGIKIFSESDFETRLKLTEIKNLRNGLLQLHYKLIRGI